VTKKVVGEFFVPARVKWFKIPTKKSKQKPGILILPAWHGIDKASKDIAGDLALGYYLHSGYLWRELRKTMQKLAKNLVTIKRTTRNQKFH
jgi:hypothetical protein